MDLVECEFCGEIKECSLSTDPLSHALRGDKTQWLICDECYELRKDEI